METSTAILLLRTRGAIHKWPREDAASWAVPGNRVFKRHVALSIAFLVFAIWVMFSAVAVRLLLDFRFPPPPLVLMIALPALASTTLRTLIAFHIACVAVTWWRYSRREAGVPC
ncbi:MAG: hypothetical protein ABIO49_10885 [Dokdonella sp.]